MQRQHVVYFHVGGHKTGTTFLQNVLWQNRAKLKGDGLLYPGTRKAAHMWANLDLRGAAFKGYRAPQVKGAWQRLVEEIAAWNGPAIIDHELFSLAAPPQIARALEDLSFAQVHVVFTARDMARQLPAAWQEWIKNGDALTFAQFLCEVREDNEHAKRLWAMHDVPTIVAKWSSGLPPEHVHVVTVPVPGSEPDILWHRFAEVLGIEPAGYRTDVGAANASLGAAEVAVMRRMNEQLGQVQWPRYSRLVKNQLTGALADRGGERIELPKDAFEWSVEQGQRIVQALTEARYDVVGDLTELVPSTRPTGVNPDEAPAEDQAAAAIAGLAAVVASEAGRDTEAELRRLRARVDQAEQRLGQWERLTPGQLVKRAAVERGRRISWLRALHRRYRALRHR